MEAFGRGLVLEPYLATIVVGAGLIAASGSEAQKGEILPAVAGGNMLLALAHGEPQARFDLNDVASIAKKDKKGGGYVLDGHKAVVWHAGAADKLLVSARTAGGQRDEKGISIFIVDPASKGVTVRSYATNDGQRAGEVLLEGVSVAGEAMVGKEGAGLPAIETVIDRARVALAAEAVGAMAALVEQTQDYLKTRKQFGVPLSKFQVLQHRLVEMFNEHQLAQALTFRACATLDNGAPAAIARTAAAVKAQSGKAGKFVGQQAIQLHGGMGMTDELPVGHYFKRLAMIDALFGNADFHLARFAGM